MGCRVHEGDRNPLDDGKQPGGATPSDQSAARFIEMFPSGDFGNRDPVAAVARPEQILTELPWPIESPLGKVQQLMIACLKRGPEPRSIPPEPPAEGRETGAEGSQHDEEMADASRAIPIVLPSGAQAVV